MPVATSDLKLLKSQSVGDVAASNGGRMSSNIIPTGVTGNIFPDVPQAERTAGSTKFRKCFYKNTNAANLPLLNSRLFLENYTQGDDAVYMHVGSQTNLQSDLTGSEKLYGCGKLDASVSAGATSMTVLIENASTQFFQNGDVVRISDRATIDGAGNEEFVTLSGAPSIAGSIVTLNFTPALVNGYTAAASRVSNVYAGGDLIPVADSFVASTVGSGDYDEVASPPTLYNNGAVFDEWTLTFTSSTAFTAAGTREGALAAGSILSDYSPTNPATGLPFFTLLSAGFTGAWTAGDTLTFRTFPAAVPLWFKRVVPASAGAIAGNRFVVGIDGETA